MRFIDYLSRPIAGLANAEQNILSSVDHTLIVHSVIVCNRSNHTMRINLKKHRISERPIEIFYLNEVEIKPYKSQDLITLLGSNIYLLSNNDQIKDELICFSNGSRQKFDCEVFYSKLNEAPYAM